MFVPGIVTKGVYALCHYLCAAYSDVIMYHKFRQGLGNNMIDLPNNQFSRP